jgi:hypothetical protein
VRQHRHHDLGIVLEAVHEQRPDRPVDQARGERLLLGRTTLTLEKAAGNLAGGEGLLLVVDGQRKEIAAGPRALLGDHGRQHGRLAILGEHRGIGLARHAPRLEAQPTAAPIQFHTFRFEHLSVSFLVGKSVDRRSSAEEPAHMCDFSKAT